jgi:hypothetical protein
MGKSIVKKVKSSYTKGNIPGFKLKMRKLGIFTGKRCGENIKNRPVG